MTERRNRAMEPVKQFFSLVPLWFPIVELVGTGVLALYWAFADRGLYRPIRHALGALGSFNVGFLIGWLLLLVPCVVVTCGVAALLQLRARSRARRDFPTAIARDRN